MSQNTNYMSKRQLKRGAAGWVLLAGLGISYVISGDFAGWNFGLAQAGWGGFVVATLAMASMYFCLVLCLAEMSSAIPTAGGGYSFARQAMGPTGGFITGLSILIEYALAPAAIVIFIGSAVNALIGIDGPIVYALFYLTFIAIHLKGVGEALKVMLVISGLALVAIFLTSITLASHFEWHNLFDISASSGPLLPFGWQGVWAALPFAMWLFLAIEGVPLAAEEAKDPTKDVPRGIIAAMSVLLMTALLVIFLLAGAAGSDLIGKSAVPLVDALNATGHHTTATLVNLLGLSGLIASFFSIIYGYSRLVFALSRAGYLPKSLSVTNRNKTPGRALIVPGVLGFSASLSGQGDLMLAMAVVGATISYALISLSHILLRLRLPQLHRPYKTPGGIMTSTLCLLLSLLALTGVYAFDPKAFWLTAGLYIIGMGYYGFYSRHHLVSVSAEEEFALINQQEETLAKSH